VNETAFHTAEGAFDLAFFTFGNGTDPANEKGS
jgi:hypothetical protein